MCVFMYSHLKEEYDVNILWNTCILNAFLIIVFRKSPCCALPQTIYFIVKETLNCRVPSHLV